MRVTNVGQIKRPVDSCFPGEQGAKFVPSRWVGSPGGGDPSPGLTCADSLHGPQGLGFLTPHFHDCTNNARLHCAEDSSHIPSAPYLGLISRPPCSGPRSPQGASSSRPWPCIDAHVEKYTAVLVACFVTGVPHSPPRAISTPRPRTWLC